MEGLRPSGLWHGNASASILPVPAQTAPMLPVPDHTAPILPVPDHTAPTLPVPAQTAPILPVPAQTASILPAHCTHTSGSGGQNARIPPVTELLDCVFTACFGVLHLEPGRMRVEHHPEHQTRMSHFATTLFDTSALVLRTYVPRHFFDWSSIPRVQRPAKLPFFLFLFFWS